MVFDETCLCQHIWSSEHSSYLGKALLILILTVQQVGNERSSFCFPAGDESTRSWSLLPELPSCYIQELKFLPPTLLCQRGLVLWSMLVPQGSPEPLPLPGSRALCLLLEPLGSHTHLPWTHHWSPCASPPWGPVHPPLDLWTEAFLFGSLCWAGYGCCAGLFVGLRTSY